MNKIRDFKNIADDIMKDVKVDEDLKKKTLQKCLKKNYRPINKALIVAACFLLIIGIANISHILPLKNQENLDITPENNLMMSVDDTESIPENSGNNILNAEEEKSWVIDTLDNAKGDFESTFIIPTYIPEDYELEKINASGFEEGKAYKIILNYFSGDKSFMIIQEKGQVENKFGNYEEIDINGTIGFLNKNISTEGENEDSMNIELHWFKDEVHYLISGLITQEDAIKIARSMK